MELVKRFNILSQALNFTIFVYLIIGALKTNCFVFSQMIISAFGIGVSLLAFWMQILSEESAEE